MSSCKRDIISKFLDVVISLSHYFFTFFSNEPVTLNPLVKSATPLKMTHKLPPNLLALFAARPALRYLPPSDHAAEERKTNNIGGVAHFLTQTHDYEEIPYAPTESWLQRKDRVKLEKKAKQEKALLEGGEAPPTRSKESYYEGRKVTNTWVQAKRRKKILTFEGMLSRRYSLRD